MGQKRTIKQKVSREQAELDRLDISDAESRAREAAASPLEALRQDAARTAFGAPASRPTVHVVGLHHTVPDETFSHCAFTGKVMRFPRVLHEAGYRVVEYSNGPGRSFGFGTHADGTELPKADNVPDEHVSIFSHAQLQDFFGGEGALYSKCTTHNNGDQEVKQAFHALARKAMRKRVRPGDIIAHVYEPMADYVAAFPDAVHVETGIGYASEPAGCYRIFESETWRAWHMGRHMAPNGGAAVTDRWPHYANLTGTAVCPNYYNPEDWALGDGSGALFPHIDDGAPNEPAYPYVLFVGRMTSGKGVEVYNALAERFPDLTFCVISGEPQTEGAGPRLTAKNIHWVGRVGARAELARWYGGALCTVVPSRFHEPFGGVAVESLLCGTPVLASDFAAFTETVQVGDGLRCMTVDDFAYALELVRADGCDGSDEWNGAQQREARRGRAIERYGIEAAALGYKAALEHFRRMHKEGVRP